MSTKTLFSGTLLAVSLTVALAGTVQAGTIWQANGTGEVDGVALGHELTRAPGSVGTTKGKHVATD